jgi:hypothetical protein
MTGINPLIRDRLGSFPAQRSRILDVADRKRNAPQSSVNSWPPASTFSNR